MARTAATNYPRGFGRTTPLIVGLVRKSVDERPSIKCTSCISTVESATQAGDTTTMITRLDPTSPEPLFQQLVSAVKAAVATGRMRPGDKLPSVRELARELVVNPNTVARAFQVLDADGVTYSRRGSGTFVAEPRPTLRKDEGLRRHRAGLDSLLAEAVHMGLSESDVRATFESALTEMQFSADPEEEDA